MGTSKQATPDSWNSQRRRQPTVLFDLERVRLLTSKTLGCAPDQCFQIVHEITSLLWVSRHNPRQSAQPTVSQSAGGMVFSSTEPGTSTHTAGVLGPRPRVC